MSNENNVELLWNCAKALNSEQHIHKLLKSYYINTCRMMAKNNLQIPKEKFAISQMCPYCGSFWSESQFELKLLPKQLKLSSKEKRLMEKFAKNDGFSKSLTKSQKNRAKWLTKKHGKRIAITCQQCKHKSFANIENVKRKSMVISPQNEKGVEDTVAPKKCEKHLLRTLKNKEYDKLSSVRAKSKKTNTKSKLKVTNKFISKTQKQNSLLQLAALLQKQTNVDAKLAAPNKILSLLK